jgi:hypothetical protein
MSSETSSKFSSDYSKAIAEALREKEDAAQELRSKEERIDDAYKALLFDDPRVDSDEACRLLAKELSRGVYDKSKKYALSERLVEGIRQATARMEVIAKKTDAQQKEDAEKDDKEEEEPEWNTTGGATPVGYAMLAVAVFCDIPVKCCQSRDLATVQALLGSYRGPQHVATEKQRVRDILEEKMNALNLEKKMEEEQKQQEGKEEEVQAAPPIDPTSKYEEVWADESDPSDFVFESNAAQGIDWSAWDDASFDPIKLSAPIRTDDWPDVQQAISNLLTDLTHSKFVPLNATLWKRHNLSDSLTQLTLLLLVDDGNKMTEALRQWSVQPINVLRDHILTKQPGQLQQHLEPEVRSCLGDYLSLIQSLIAVDAAQEDPKAEMAPASIVGLASLSSVCTQAKQLKEVPKIRKTVLESCEDLCSLVERALACISKPADGAAAEAVTSWVPLVWAFLPLLELIAYTQPDGTSLDTIRTVTNADAQWLLNSGLFRNLIMVYVKTESYSSSAEEVARQHLLQGLQMLSLQCMTLLGKYLWRVPDLNKLIHADAYQEKHVVEGLLWSLMGQQLAGASVLRMRNVKAVTADSLRESAIRQWELLCSQVVAALKTLGELRTETTKKELPSHAWKEPISELGRFTNCFGSCAALSTLWQEALTKTALQEHLQPIKEALSTLPPPPVVEVDKDGAASTTKTADNDKAGDPLERPNDSFEVEVGMVRKAIKVVTMSLQQEGASASLRISSKTD